jgi:hypothetical protein
VDPDPVSDPQHWPEVVSVLRAVLQLEHLVRLYAELAGAAHERALHLLCEAVQLGAQLAQIFVKVGFDEELAMAHLVSGWKLNIKVTSKKVFFFLSKTH